MFTKANGDFVGVAAANDGLGGAAIAVLERNGQAGKIPVTGQDATDEGLQRVLLGTQCMTVYKAIKKEAEAAAALAIALINGDQAAADALATGATADSETGMDVPSVLLVPQGITKDKGDQWQIFRRGSALIDPDTNEVLGYEATYLGEARVSKHGEVATIDIVRSTQEIYRDDRLIALGKQAPVFAYVPHSPLVPVKGRIISTYGSLQETGPLSIVALSKGSKDGLQVGAVLAIERSQTTARYSQRTEPLFGRSGPSGSDAPRVYYTEPLPPRDVLVGKGDAVTRNDIAKLPDDRYGMVMVFRTFDRASFALVMQASRPVAISDVVTNP
jgi:hypothetical protein